MLNIVDLFSGVGGFSLGAARANFNVLGAIELDENIAFSHRLNFPYTNHLQADISTLSAVSIANLMSIDIKNINGLIGGPPCQGFSSMGKGNVSDSRNSLFEDFFRLVSEVKPMFFVAENVPGILASKYEDIRARAFKIVEGHYDLMAPLVLSAEKLGAPTTRSRVFFIGFRKNLRLNVKNSFFSNLLKEENATYVKDALSGLPVSIEGNWKEEGQLWTKINFAEKSFFTERLYGLVPQGVGNSEALAKLEQGLVSGCIGTKHAAEVANRYASLKPNEHDKVSRSVRLNLDGFCPTLRAGTGQDKGSFQAVRPIHPTEPRVITPREAARLQGFPDWFMFHPTKWHSFRQIGNSVSPIVSEKLMKAIYIILENHFGKM